MRRYEQNIPQCQCFCLPHVMAACRNMSELPFLLQLFFFVKVGALHLCLAQRRMPARRRRCVLFQDGGSLWGIADSPYFSGQQKGVMCLFGGVLCAIDNLRWENMQVKWIDWFWDKTGHWLEMYDTSRNWFATFFNAGHGEMPIFWPLSQLLIQTTKNIGDEFYVWGMPSIPNVALWK